MLNATILIVARNAASTIGRAMGSALKQGDYPIVVVDDGSSDDTGARAKALGSGKTRVMTVESHGALGKARQLGLGAIDTRYGVLLDADDALLPGRVDRLVAAMESDGTDVVFDEIELWEEVENRFIKTLRIPDFLDDGSSLCRLFERNYLPGIGQMGFRTAFFKNIGYDTAAHGPEDTDIVLRSLIGGATFSLLREVGYRMYHSANSVSRNLKRQNAELKRILAKHSYQQVADLYREAGYDMRVSLWGRHSLATFRRDTEAMSRFLGELARSRVALEKIWEPEGPLPMSEGWRLGFARGVLNLLEGNAKKASDCFRAISTEAEAAEVFNNWGVAEVFTGNVKSARNNFERALKLFPGYSDAAANLRNPELALATYLPLRRQASRNMY